MEIKTILWPTDLSDRSLKAAGMVRQLSEKHQANVILLYVGFDIHTLFPAYGEHIGEDFYQHFREWQDKHAREKLGHLCDEELSSCFGLDTRIRLGDPAEEIVKAAGEYGADVIVMASHGLTNAAERKNMLGSVADKVARTSPVPVMLVRSLEK